MPPVLVCMQEEQDRHMREACAHVRMINSASRAGSRAPSLEKLPTPQPIATTDRSSLKTNFDMDHSDNKVLDLYISLVIVSSHSAS